MPFCLTPEMPILSFFSTSLLLVTLVVSPVSAQMSDGAEPAPVLILGTYHFANPGLDIVQVDVADVLSDSRQAEIRELIEKLATFGPTKIAVEQTPESAPQLDSLFQAYRSGTHELSRNEVQQLGFRLAARLDHARIYPIDHHGEFPFGAVMEYAQEHDPSFVDFVHAELARITAESNRRQREHTIGQILRLSNDPKELAADHGSYLRFARVGAGDSYVGADLLSKWYDRNIRIHANLQRIVEPGDRVIVIIGSGHAPILRELTTFDPAMRLVDTLDYLPAE
jgi:hypothetical protein